MLVVKLQGVCFFFTLRVWCFEYKSDSAGHRNYVCFCMWYEPIYDGIGILWFLKSICERTTLQMGGNVV